MVAGLDSATKRKGESAERNRRRSREINLLAAKRKRKSRRNLCSYINVEAEEPQCLCILKGL